jgi:glycosyltransferase involved in cell wall biosynthesis
MKKILIQTDSPEMGGAEKYLLDIIPALKNAGYELSFLCLNVQGIKELRKEINAHGVFIEEVSKRYYFNLLDIFKIIRLILKHHIVFVNKIDPSKSLFIIFLSLLCSKRVICVEHLPIEIKSKYWFKPPILRKIIYCLMKNVYKIICISNYSKDFFSAEYCYSSNLIKVIPNGIDLPPIISKATHVLPLKPIRIALVGRLCIQKGQLPFLSILKKVVNNLHKTDLVVDFWGEGDLKILLLKEIERLNLGCYIRFRGYTSNKELLYRDNHFLVMPSLSEGFPFVLLEAASYRKPVIAYDVGGIKDFINNMVNGILAPPSDEESFTKAMILLIQNPKILKNFGDNAYERVSKEFKKEEMLTQTLSVLECALESQK